MRAPKSPWVSIDLHTHTKVGITRDGKKDQVVFSYLLFLAALRERSIRLMACTNHNSIDFAQYVALRYLAKLNGCNFLLGVELDTVVPGTDKPLHVAMIADSSDAERDFRLANDVNRKAYEKKSMISCHKEKSIIFTSTEIVEYLGRNRVVLIPHGDKDKGLLNRPTKDEIDTALQLVKENFIHVLDSKASKWKLEQVKACLDDIERKYKDDFGGVLFSDCHDWTKYGEGYLGFAMDAEPTFNGFLHAISNPTKRFAVIEDAINPTNYISYAIFDNGHGETKLLFSPRYNCIIGKSGSGKSLFLHLLKKALNNQEDDANYAKYNYSLKLFGPNGQELKPNDIHPITGLSIYREVIGAISSDDDQNKVKLIKGLAQEGLEFIQHAKYLKAVNSFSATVAQYVRLWKGLEEAKRRVQDELSNFQVSAAFLAKNKLSKGLNILGSEPPIPDSPNEVNYSQIRSSFVSIKTELYKYNGSKKDITRRVLDAFERLLALVQSDDERRKAKYLLEKAKKNAIHNAINAVNGHIGEFARAISQTGQNIGKQKDEIVRYLLNAYQAKQKCQSLDLALDLSSFAKVKTTIASGVEVLETIQDPTQITQYRQRDQHGFFKIRGFSTAIPAKTRDLTKQSHVMEMLNDLIRAGIFDVLDKNGAIDIDASYLRIQTDILFDGQDVAKLNPGDIAKKYIEIYFKNRVMGKPNSIIIFDQIENDVDKPFLKEDIVKHIEDCYKQSQIFIVTHDPIVAVNADPRRYILAEKAVRKQISYRSFAPESEERDELDTIAKCVDGSKEVIKHRFEVYEKENTL